MASEVRFLSAEERVDLRLVPAELLEQLLVEHFIGVLGDALPSAGEGDLLLSQLVATYV